METLFIKGMSFEVYRARDGQKLKVVTRPMGVEGDITAKELFELGQWCTREADRLYKEEESSRRHGQVYETIKSTPNNVVPFVSKSEKEN